MTRTVLHIGSRIPFWSLAEIERIERERAQKLEQERIEREKAHPPSTFGERQRRRAEERAKRKRG